MSAEYPLNINGEPYKANRTNTSLFTFAGELCLYDHVFMTMTEDDTNYQGAYVFDAAQPELYKKLHDFIIANNLPQILNRNDVPECDQAAWNRKMYGDLGDGVPPEWTS